MIEAKVVNRGNCMLCGKELTEDEGIFCKECEGKGMSTNKILLDTLKTPEEKVYLIAKEIKDSGQVLHNDLWYAILDLKDKNFPTLGNDIDYFTKVEPQERSDKE